MKRSTKTWLGAIGVFVAYVVIAVLVVVLARVSGARMWWIGGTLTLLGLISAGILLWYFRDSLREPAPASPAASIDAILAAARANLAASKGGTASKLGAQPMLLVVGPQDATKTTAIVRSGLDPELLAGEVSRGETVAPTETVNLWFVQNTVVVEAGGPVMQDLSS